MIFTRKNAQTAVRYVRDIEGLGRELYVPQRRREEIQRRSGGDRGQQRKKYVDYFMDHDPLASWRQVIVVLDQLKFYGYGGKPEKIRHLAEAVTGEGR